MTLDENSVHSIDDEGGSILGSGRCSMNAKTVVDALLKKNVNTTMGTHITPSAVWVQYRKKLSADRPRSVLSNKKAFSFPSQNESEKSTIPITSEIRIAYLVGGFMDQS